MKKTWKVVGSNLNKVECKFLIFTQLCYYFLCSNLNKVECKYDRGVRIY